MTDRTTARRPGLKFILLAVLAVMLTASVSACGRKSSPFLPDEMQEQDADVPPNSSQPPEPQ